MRSSTKYCFLTVILSLLIGFIVFIVFANYSVELPATTLFFVVLILFAGASLLSILIATLLAGRTRTLRDAYCCCGNLATVGGIATVLSAFLTSLSDSYSGILFSIGLALCMAFLTLLLGGIFCFLYAYHCCQQANTRVYPGAYQNQDVLRPEDACQNGCQLPNHMR